MSGDYAAGSDWLQNKGFLSRLHDCVSLALHFHRFATASCLFQKRSVIVKHDRFILSANLLIPTLAPEFKRLLEGGLGIGRPARLGADHAEIIVSEGNI